MRPDLPRLSWAKTVLTMALLSATTALVACSYTTDRVARGGGSPIPGLEVRRALPTSASAMPLATPLVRSSDHADGPPGLAVLNQESPPPLRVGIPAIGVDVDLGRVGLKPDGTIAVPSDWNQPAWYTAGPAPGAQGPAVIVGHLDSDTGPAVFWRLGQLRPGDLIEVTRTDLSVLHFRVVAVGDFARDRFPTADVYGPTPAPTLRLITCAGSFDWSVHRYSDNIVVFADEA